MRIFLSVMPTVALSSIILVAAANAATPADDEAVFLREETQIATEQFSAASSKADEEGKLATDALRSKRLNEACGHLETQVTQSLTAENWAHQIIDLSERSGQPNPESAGMLKSLDKINLDQFTAYKQRCLPLSNIDPNGQINISSSLSGRLRLIRWLFDDALNRLQAADIEARSQDYKSKGTCFDTGIADRQINRVRIEIDEFERFGKLVGLDLQDVELLRKNADTASGLSAQLTKRHCSGS